MTVDPAWWCSDWWWRWTYSLVPLTNHAWPIFLTNSSSPESYDGSWLPAIDKDASNTIVVNLDPARTSRIRPEWLASPKASSWLLMAIGWSARWTMVNYLPQLTTYLAANPGVVETMSLVKLNPPGVLLGDTTTGVFQILTTVACPAATVSSYHPTP